MVLSQHTMTRANTGVMPVLLFGIIIILHVAEGRISVPDLPDRPYVRNGDVILGGLFPITKYSATKPCGDSLWIKAALQLPEAMRFAIELINNSTELLPNVTLGFAMLDTCMKESTALAQSMKFAPYNETGCHTSGVGGGNESSLLSGDYFHVAGVVGAGFSVASIGSAGFLTLFHIPQVSYASTSDTLSDKVKYPYFLRVVPPDKLQVQAMVDILNKFGWTYVSVLYVDSDYGETAAKTVRKLTKDFGICIAVDRVVSDSFQQSDWDLTVSMLLNARNARAVLLIMHISPAIELFKAVKRADAMGVFQWIGSDGVSVGIADLGDSADAAEGILTIRPGFDYAREFNTWFKGLHPAIRSDNPYFMEHWELYFDCSWTNGTGKPTCDEDNRMTEANGFAPMSFATLVIDTTLVFAHALHSLIEERCPGVVGQNVSKCINGSLLLKYLLEVEFQGHIGRVKFDKQGDILAQYDIEQLQNKSSDYKQVAVASWDADVGHVQLVDQNPIIWVTSESVSLETPESVCSKPCGKGEFYLQKELSCCWECRKCRNNEYLVSNQTSCKECPELMWPVESLTSCESVQPEHMRWGDSLAITILTFSIIGIILAAFILAFFIRHNNAKLIKACSRELAYLILTGVFVSYLTAIFFLAKPEDHFCYVEHFGFSLSFAWIYAPLFTRTNRIYRIFASGKKTKKRPPLVSPRSQVIIASLLITIEVIISIITAAVNPPGIEQRMPVKTEKFVELLCKLPIQGIVASLAYNILLVAMCSFYAFKTRKLPDNFNESKFISMCVYTTLVIWLAFIPTYFTTSAAYFRVVLLSVALILNATVVLAFLYAPKVYAIAYVDADTIQINQLNPTTSVSPLAGSSNMTSLQGQGRVAASITVEPRPFTAREATYEHHHDLAVATIS